MSQRLSQGIEITWQDGATDSDPVNITGGAFGSLLVLSALNGKTLQVKTYIPDTGYYKSAHATAFDGINLLASAKTLATGANYFTSSEICQLGAAGPVKFVLNSAVSGSITRALLLWKD